MPYKFYHIKTYRTLDWLEQLLYQVGYATNQMYLKVIKDNHGKETDRTIAFLDENVFTLLMQHNRPDFTIEPFVVPKSFLPNDSEYTYNFCIPFPKQDSIIDHSKRDSYYIRQIESKLSPFISQGALAHGSYKITIPVVSRERNETKGIAFVSFHPSVSKNNIALIRYILDGSLWDDRVNHMRCSWARLSKKIAHRSP